MKKIIRIHGTSSKIVFDCDDTTITASGEFSATNGKIDGFFVDTLSLKNEKGDLLSAKNVAKLKALYNEYATKHANKSFTIHWEM